MMTERVRKYFENLTRKDFPGLQSEIDELLRKQQSKTVKPVEEK